MRSSRAQAALDGATGHVGSCTELVSSSFTAWGLEGIGRRRRPSKQGNNPSVHLYAAELQGALLEKRCLNIQSLYSLIAGKAWIAFLSLPDVRSTLFTAKLIIIMGLEEIGHETGITFKCSP